jgi:hypothetical protein
MGGLPIHVEGEIGCDGVPPDQQPWALAWKAKRG